MHPGSPGFTLQSMPARPPIAASILPEAADELRAVVGLELDQFEVYAAVSQVFAQQAGKQTGAGRALFIAEAQKHQPASDFSSGKLVFGQRQTFHLGPVMRDIL